MTTLTPEQTAASLIKKYRQERGLTLEQLAQKVGSRKAYMWQLENKPAPQPTVQMAIKISRALTIPIDVLFPVDGQSSQHSSTLAKLDAGTHVLVPVEPTNEMIVLGLGWRQWDAPDGWPLEARQIYGTWRAMITAAQEGK